MIMEINMVDNGSSPVYVGGNDGFGFGNGGFMAFLIFALLMGNGFGGWGNGNGNSNAIQNDINRGFDNQNLQAQTRDILSAVTNGTAQTVAQSAANASNAINAIKDGNAALIREFGTVETALTALSGKQQECCCNTLRAIDGVNYNNALNTASINANTTEQTQKILDAIAGNRMADMQNQINQLQLQNALAGVVRYPNAWTYNAGVSPFCGCNNGCGC
jgi:hypothetical protein